MKKRRILFLFAALFLTSVLASTALGESRSASSSSDVDPHSCWVPYNVKTLDGKWATGLNITSNRTFDTITARFYAPGQVDPYATETVPLDTGGIWTGMVQNLLATPGNFVSGSLITFKSIYGAFSVTQFIVYAIPTQVGFSHQTFYAIPGNFYMP